MFLVECGELVAESHQADPQEEEWKNFQGAKVQNYMEKSPTIAEEYAVALIKQT